MPVCEYCRPHRVLPSENEMHKHISAEHPYRCTLCPDSLEFGSHYAWINHYSTRHQTRCPYCDVIMGGGNQARLHHFRQVHDYHPCTICLSCFESEAELAVHYDDPTVDAHRYSCARCNRRFVNGQDFWYHCFDEHRFDGDGGSLVCPVCDEKIGLVTDGTIPNDQIQWKAHLKTKHHLVPCTDCFEVFCNEYEGKQHYKDQHRVVCPVCQADFPDNESKTSHFNANHRFTCANCPNLSFMNATLREEHVNVAHKIKCSECTTYFDTALEFEYHFLETHRSTCTYCVKSFATEELLLLHTNQTHKFLCAVCDEYLDHGETLRYHYKVLHRLQCDLCTTAKVCSSETELQMHYSAVHGVGSKQVENKYVCSTCQGVYDSEQLLVMHYKEKHLRQWDVSPPRMSSRSFSTSD